MESVYSNLTARALHLHEQLRLSHPQRRTVIALAGPPGSGKSTVAAEVVKKLNEQPTSPYAVAVPMDGFHLPRHTLDALPNSLEAYARRGAAWTFDANGVVNLVQSLHPAHESEAPEVIFAPSFDHKLKDPLESGIEITPDMTLIILEGNWVLRDEDPWRQISSLVDDTWFVDVKPELARERIARRHLDSGIETNWADALRRAEGNDLVNGEEVRRKLVTPAVTVESVDVPSSSD